MKKEEYSPIEHLATITNCSNWEEVLMGMFTVCFDAGGSDHDQEYLVVAGFVSSAKDWKDFECAWVTRLKEDGIEYFHMVEFAHSMGQFKNGWKNNELKRRKLLTDLMFIIKSHVYRRFGCVIENKVFINTLSKEQRDKWLLSAYTLAAITCAGQVYNWISPFSYNSPIPLEFVFEKGDAGKGKLIERFESDLNITPVFKPKRNEKNSFGIIPAFIPLQAADFWAYEIFVGCKKMNQPNYKARWAVKEFGKMVGSIGIQTVTNLEQLDQDLKVSEATLNWTNKFYGNV